MSEVVDIYLFRQTGKLSNRSPEKQFIRQKIEKNAAIQFKINSLIYEQNMYKLEFEILYC